MFVNKTEETKITGEILKVKEQEELQEDCNLGEKGHLSQDGRQEWGQAASGGEAGRGAMETQGSGLLLLCLEWWVGDLQNEILVQKCSWGKPKGAVRAR